MELFEPALNYPMEIDEKTRLYYLRNRSPRSGEPPRYLQTPNRDQTYVDIAMVPNIDKLGMVLILNAIDMVGVEAAVDFAVRGSLASSLAGAPAGRAIEILLRVTSIGGTASKAEIEAVREVHPGAIGASDLVAR